MTTSRLAALRPRRLKDLIQEGLRLVLDAPPHKANPRDLAELMQPARGVVESGIPDLASNSEHLKGFGHDAGDH
jgi:predicted component of type VI protein secretion system